MYLFLGGFATVTLLILPFLIVGEIYGAMEFFKRISFISFLMGKEWSLAEGKYGALPAIYGTLVVAGLALLIAIPISIGAAIALVDILPRSIAERLSVVVDVVASIPSVVIGLWGLTVLGPLLQESLYKFLAQNLSFIPLFQTATITPYNKLTASLVLAYMVTPYAVAVIKEGLKLVPHEVKEGAYAIGLTRYEVYKVMLGYIKPSILAAFMLALGRAVGEAVAVSMVIGNTPSFSPSLLDPAATLTTLIINNFSEATGIEAAALIGLGVILFLVSLALVSLTRVIYSRLATRYVR